MILVVSFQNFLYLQILMVFSPSNQVLIMFFVLCIYFKILTYLSTTNLFLLFLLLLHILLHFDVFKDSLSITGRYYNL